ncbi:hypothetical protein [Streptomyces sp. NPDC048734]
MAWLFRRSKAARQADADGTVTEETVTEEAAAQETAVTSGAPAGSSGGGAGAEESAEDGVGIPRQQPSGKAADNEAGESART